MKTTLKAPGFGADAMAEASAMQGEEFRIEQWNHEASRDVVRHYAWGIGDDNPLWSDPDHASGTRWGGIIAPPTFCYGIFDAVIAPGLPDIQWIYSGADWQFHRPIRRDEPIRARATLHDVRETGGGVVSRMIVQTGRVEYLDREDKPVATVLSHCFRIPRQSAEGGLRYEHREEPTYTQEELERIEQAMLNEYRRGADRLDLARLTVGEDIPVIERGPLNRLDMTCYYAGAVGTSGYKSTKLKWLYSHYARHSPEKLPNNYDPSYYSAAVSPSIGHQDSAIAQSEIGMPGPYDNGPQRIGMMASAVTNWMGDDASLTELNVRLKRPVIFGDVSRFGGTITGINPNGNGGGEVALDLVAQNQLGDVTARGTARVQVPAD